MRIAADEMKASLEAERIIESQVWAQKFRDQLGKNQEQSIEIEHLRKISKASQEHLARVREIGNAPFVAALQLEPRNNELEMKIIELKNDAREKDAQVAALRSEIEAMIATGTLDVAESSNALLESEVERLKGLVEEKVPY